MSAGLAFTYSGRDAALLHRVLPHIDYIEITPDIFARRDADGVRLDPDVVAELRELQAERPLIAHGVGLSIGSHDGLSEDYLRLLDHLFTHLDVTWHSEHLGYTTVGGEFLGAMLTLPRDAGTLALVAERIERIQRRFPRPFLIENVAALLPDPPNTLAPAAFLNALTERTGCGLLLDLFNLECDQANLGLDIDAFLDELDLQSVVEIHVACGVEHHGYWLDVHSRLLRPSTLEWLDRVRPRCPDLRAVTYEIMPEAVPFVGAEAIAGQLADLAKRLG